METQKLIQQAYSCAPQEQSGIWHRNPARAKEETAIEMPSRYFDVIRLDSFLARHFTTLENDHLSSNHRPPLAQTVFVKDGHIIRLNFFYIMGYLALCVRCAYINTKLNINSKEIADPNFPNKTPQLEMPQGISKLAEAFSCFWFTTGKCVLIIC